LFIKSNINAALILKAKPRPSQFHWCILFSFETLYKICGEVVAVLQLQNHNHNDYGIRIFCKYSVCNSRL